MLYKFRAECSADVIKWFEEVQNDIKKITIDRPEKTFPDVLVTISTNLELFDIKSSMIKISDTHVMSETIATIDKYDGKRISNGKF